jgi:2-aminoethylphosphonate-pyruvate transaminase
MTTDLGSRDVAFIQVIKDVRSGLLKLAGVSEQEYTTVPIQGSGTFGVESVLCSAVDKKKGIFIIANGAYGMRMTSICAAHNIPFTVYECPDDTPPSLTKIEEMLKNEAREHTSVSVVHSETTSGIVNDVESIGALVAKYNKTFIVDAMSSFGAVPVCFKKGHIDFLVSSANKCVEGVPGFSFAIARKTSLQKCKGNKCSNNIEQI